MRTTPGSSAKTDLELREINLSLLAWWGLEAHFERRCKPRPHLAQKVGHRGVAAVIALLADLAQQPAAGQARIGDDPLAQISLEGFKLPWPRLAWAIGRRLQAALDVFAHCLAIDADPPRDRRDAQPLPMKIQDHDELPKLDHRLPLPPSGGIIERRVYPPSSGAPREGGFTPGEFSNGESGEHHSGNDNPKLTGWVEENIEETLSFYRLPRQHHKHLKSTNMLERLNEEIKRRTHVVRIFPNGESCLRLVRALAVETHENWLEQHRYLNMDDLREHKKEVLRRAA